MGLIGKKKTDNLDEEWADLDLLLPKKERKNIKQKIKVEDLNEDDYDEEEVEDNPADVDVIKRKPRSEDSWQEMMRGLIDEDDEEENAPEDAPEGPESVFQAQAPSYEGFDETPLTEAPEAPEPVPIRQKIRRPHIIRKVTREPRIIGRVKEEPQVEPEPPIEEAPAESIPVRQEVVITPMPNLTTAESEAMQRKIIWAFLHGTQMLEKSDVPVDSQSEMLVFAGMRDGRITETDERELLNAIKSPVDKYGENGVYRRLVDEREQRILAYHTGVGFTNPEQTDGVTVKQFLKKYPLPQDFEAAAAGFLKTVRRNSSDSTYAEYVNALRNFKWQIYGNRQLFYEQLKIVKRKAEEIAMAEIGLVKTNESEVKKILKATTIRGDAWIKDRIERRLSTQILLRNGLHPRYKITFSGIPMTFSGSFRVGTRDVIIGYIEFNGETVARSYYRNNSQGIWRYLPDYALRRNNAGRSEVWCGQAYADEMLILPALLQKELTAIAAEGLIKNIIDEPEFLFVGTAKRYESMKEYLAYRKEGQLTGDIYQEVSTRPTVVFSGGNKTKSRPTDLVIEDENARPDFSRAISEWSMSTGLFGKITAYSYLSKDLSLEYVFVEDQKQRAYLRSIDIKSDVTSTGLYSEWAYAGDLSTPLYETIAKSDGFGDDNDIKGGYICMWKKYISKITIVKEFLRAKMDHK